HTYAEYVRRPLRYRFLVLQPRNEKRCVLPARDAVITRHTDHLFFFTRRLFAGAALYLDLRCSSRNFSDVATLEQKSPRGSGFLGEILRESVLLRFRFDDSEWRLKQFKSITWSTRTALASKGPCSGVPQPSPNVPPLNDRTVIAWRGSFSA